MDEILAALVALVHWRLVLSTLGSIALAFALSNIIPLFTAAYCITLVIFGFAFGLVWQGRADSGLSLTETTEDPNISKPVAFVDPLHYCAAQVSLLSGFILFGVALVCVRLCFRSFPCSSAIQFCLSLPLGDRSDL